MPFEAAATAVGRRESLRVLALANLLPPFFPSELVAKTKGFLMVGRSIVEVKVSPISVDL